MSCASCLVVLDLLLVNFRTYILPQNYPGIWRSPESFSCLSSPSGFSFYLVHSIKFSQYLPSTLNLTLVIWNWMKWHNPVGGSRVEQGRHTPNTGIIPPSQDLVITKGTLNTDSHTPCPVFVLKVYYPSQAQQCRTESILSYCLEHTETAGTKEKRFNSRKEHSWQTIPEGVRGGGGGGQRARQH